MGKKTTNYFWTGYADLMTSVFFVMLVLFVTSSIMLARQIQISQALIEELEELVDISQEAIDRVNEVTTALEALDPTFFSYDSESMRYRLNIDIVFRPNDDDIQRATTQTDRYNLERAGTDLYRLIREVSRVNPEINYLLIIEGNTQRTQIQDSWNHIIMPDAGYHLSYRRALALFNFWKNAGIDFSDIDNCEILIAGSGYFGKSREPMLFGTDSERNRRFTIQIAPKIGEIKLDKTP